MTYQNNELIQKLQAIEAMLQNQEINQTELERVVEELKNIVQSLDKEVAIQAEKQSHLYYIVEKLQKEVELLEQKDVKTNDKQRTLIENMLMAFLGGLITYIFSTMGGK